MFKIINANCLEAMREMEPDSVDAIVTDPPYGLSFMGKKWDYDVPSVDIWRECLRVLKPGGHLLAFAGTRTQHRMAVNIEDAGFDIRDMIAWVYGSGFPKSHNLKDEWQGWGTALKPSQEPLTWAQKPLNVVPHGVMVQTEQTIACVLCLLLSPAKIASVLSPSSHHAYGAVSGSAQVIAAVSQSAKNAKLPEVTAMFKSPEMAAIALSIVRSWSSILAEVYARKSTFTTLTACETTTALRTFSCLISEIMPSIITREECQQLGKVLSVQGVVKESSGTASNCGNPITAQELVTLLPTLKLADSAMAAFMAAVRAGSSVLLSATTEAEELSPALEPITVARKPFKGTVAANVLEHGTAALNVDGCRVGASGGTKAINFGENRGDKYGGGAGKPTNEIAELSAGRWPANLIHDGSDEVVGLLDAAARFFYCAKTSKKDRGEGNNHPTVKPTDLMRYLCRLVTPPDGVVLDPFMGSGSTGKAATLEGLDFIGIELDPDYCEIARGRIGV